MKYEFEFDFVFDLSATQDSVFQEISQHLTVIMCVCLPTDRLEVVKPILWREEM